MSDADTSTVAHSAGSISGEDAEALKNHQRTLRAARNCRQRGKCARFKYAAVALVAAVYSEYSTERLQALAGLVENSMTEPMRALLARKCDNPLEECEGDGS